MTASADPGIWPPRPGAASPPHRPGGPEVRTGGAEDFLRFIQTELKPVIADLVKTDPARQALWGHSFGGLFVLHSLFKEASAFTDWISISPSIWWEDCALLTEAERFAARKDGPPARVLLAVGEYEETLAPFQRHAPDAQKRAADHKNHREVTRTQEMAIFLAGVSGVTTSYHFLPEETHMSVLPQSLNLAIRFAFGLERD